MYKITIVTVTYNCEESIEKTMLSVLNQIDENYEYILIDGESTDKTLEKILEIKNKYIKKEIKVISEKDKGIYDAMNKGIELSQGEWIYFLNSGDFFVNNEVISNVFQKNINAENAEILYGDIILTHPKYGVIKRKSKKINLIKNGMVFYHQGAFVKTYLMKENLFNLKYKICADYNFFYSMYKKKIRFKKYDLSIALYDLTGLSSQNRKQLVSEKYDILKKDLKIIEKNLLLGSLFKEHVKNILPNKFQKLIKERSLKKIFNKGEN